MKKFASNPYGVRKWYDVDEPKMVPGSWLRRSAKSVIFVLKFDPEAHTHVPDVHTLLVLTRDTAVICQLLIQKIYVKSNGTINKKFAMYII